ncbi:uncharacterized protein CC84DRAFT_735202 [Paraphaeosphaeria sporulosa]|uniref:Fungal-specific transcription factor domain-containing protein n=1 Tax=Paraphaeosphaeria sporulosa TaxID=1460663 RepID=A0A177CGE8_9PLEO|nr:uncharacterized protein CC84DRAFT_735202 [Paraphaeosphaeria sporulosa]OAG05777.1 hypothetical protein CC84DRAFT_735202 [Paraphaeosphaeria sporulosa]
MDADRRLVKALEAANDALQHLSMSPDFGCLDCTHIDRLLARVVDLPTEGNQRNSRRNLLVIRQWMITEGPGVVLLEVLGQLYWRLGELNAKQFEKFKTTLQAQQSYLALIQDTGAVTLVIQRIRHIQRSKADACQDFLCELSDLTGAKVDSPMADMDVMRARSSSPFSPGHSSHSSHHSVISFDSSASQEEAFTSLVKYVPDGRHFGGDMEQLLFDFFINGICPGRTPATQTNTYLSLFQTANICESTKFALLSLSASYIREYLHSDKERYHQAELYYSGQAFQALGQQISNGEDYDAALSTAMLLMHHGAINDSDEASLCWSVHANIFDIIPSEFIDHASEPALYMRTQLVLARTGQTAYTLESAPLPQSLQANNWLDGMQNGDAQKICSILGMSPQLVFFISSINSLATENAQNKHMYAQVLETQIQNLTQWTPEPQGDGRDIILATAESFRLAALIYLRCRLYGLTRFNPAIMELNDALTAVILSLPVKGHLYTAIYPVWPVFIAAVTANSDKRDCLYQRVVPIREGDKNTLPAVLKRVSGMRIWFAKQDPTALLRDGWWDEMLLPSSSTTAVSANRLLCLG